MCSLYGGEASKAEIAGICHDYARELSSDELFQLAFLEYRIEPWERERPILLHGKVGAICMKRDMGVTDETIIEAVRAHVTGEPGMGHIAKIIFIADYLEPGRKHIDTDLRNKIGVEDIDTLLYYVLIHIFNHLKNNGRLIVKPAMDLYKQLQSKVRCFEEKRWIR